MPPIVSIVGKSNSGKTTLIEKLIPLLKKRGFRVGVIKHALHGFEIDKKGKDSWRHKAAGADTVIVASPESVAMVKDGACDSLPSLEPYVTDMDLVIAEGFKRGDQPKIEIVRSARNSRPICKGDGRLIALVTDLELDLAVPVFGLEEISRLADFIVERFLSETS